MSDENFKAIDVNSWEDKVVQFVQNYDTDKDYNYDIMLGEFQDLISPMLDMYKILLKRAGEAKYNDELKSLVIEELYEEFVNIDEIEEEEEEDEEYGIDYDDDYEDNWEDPFDRFIDSDNDSFKIVKSSQLNRSDMTKEQLIDLYINEDWDKDEFTGLVDKMLDLMTQERELAFKYTNDKMSMLSTATNIASILRSQEDDLLNG